MSERSYFMYLLTWGVIFLIVAVFGAAARNSFLFWWSAVFATYVLRGAWIAREEARWPFWPQQTRR